jgi:LL-diaminopimelate aminotransferase
VIKLSKRIENLPAYLFVRINQKIADKKARGEEIINFGAGDPDIPTPPAIIDELCRAARVPANHRYPDSAGTLEFRRAVAEWYQRRFNVELDPEEEVVSLIGAKEGIFHIATCFIDPGDVALVPDPGYPVYSIGTNIAGGTSHFMPLKETNGFLPEFDRIPSEVLKKAKLMWLNYPNNPTGAVASLDFFEKAVKFAAKNDIIICHDGPYTEVAYDGYQPVSFLQARGAKKIGIEFHSLSKTYNMAGWRIGMAVGNAKIIDALKTLKSNIDSGIPRAIQSMGIAALKSPPEWIGERNKIYQKRRDRLAATLHNIGIQANLPRAGLYVWAKCPEGFSSEKFAEDLLDKVGVVVPPGNGYGPTGEGYVRFSLTVPDGELEKGLELLRKWRELVRGGLRSLNIL